MLEKDDLEKVDQSLVKKQNDEERGRGLQHKVIAFVRRNLLLILTLAGVFLGFILGFGFRELHPSPDALLWIGMPGDLYIRILKSMIIPLIICSVISCAAALDPKSNGKISGIATIFIVSTNILGCVIAIVLCLVLKPGENVRLYGEYKATQKIDTQDIFADLLRNLFPSNVVEATFRQTQTTYKEEIKTVDRNTTNGTQTETISTFVKEVGTSDGPNILGLIVICTVIGIAASTMKEKGKPFVLFFTSAMDVILQVLRWLLWFTPIGVMSLIAKPIAGIEDVSSIFEQLGMFVATVTIGIILQQVLVLPLILFVTTRRNPFLFMLSIVRPWMIGFAATSTAVAIPEMLHSCEVKNKIDKRVARFVIPFSVTLSANGSALYITTAAIFIGNISNYQFDAGSILVIGVLTAAASMALPSVPSSSIVSLVMILTSMGITVDAIAFLFAVEWYLDRIRTTSSVVSHTFCAAVTYQFCRKDLKKQEEEVNGLDVIEIHL